MIQNYLLVEYNMSMKYFKFKEQIISLNKQNKIKIIIQKIIVFNKLNNYKKFNYKIIKKIKTNKIIR